MKKLSSLSVVMPCYNDSLTIERAVGEAWSVARRVAEKFEIIVVNDTSTDESGKKLDALQKKYRELLVITHPVNQGYGATIRELYYTARYDWLFSVPGDYQIGAEELTKLLSEKDTADMILGLRVNRQDPQERLRQSKIYNRLLRLLFGLKLRDVNTVRLMPTHIFRSVRLLSTSAFVDAELAIRMARQGYRIAEVPIGHRMDIKKPNGKGGGGGRFRTIYPTIRDMLVFWLTE